MRYVAGVNFGRVIVGGVELNDVEECDTELGFAVVVDRDSDGRIVLDGERIRRRLVTGPTEFIENDRHSL